MLDKYIKEYQENGIVVIPDVFTDYSIKIYNIKTVL